MANRAINNSGFEHSFFIPLLRLRGCALLLPLENGKYKPLGYQYSVYVEHLDDTRGYAWYQGSVWSVEKRPLTKRIEEEEDGYVLVEKKTFTNDKVLVERLREQRQLASAISSDFCAGIVNNMLEAV